MANLTLQLTRQYVQEHSGASSAQQRTYRCEQRFVRKLNAEAISSVALGAVVSTDGALSYLLRSTETRDELTTALADYNLLEQLIVVLFGANSALYKHSAVASHATVQRAVEQVYSNLGRNTQLLLSIFFIDLLEHFQIFHDSLEQSVLIDLRAPEAMTLAVLREEVTDRLLIDGIIHALKEGKKGIAKIELPSRVNMRSYVMDIYHAFRALSVALDDAAYRLVALDDVLALTYARVAQDNSQERIYGRVEQLSYLDPFVKNATIVRLASELRGHTPTIAATEMRAEAERIQRALLSMARYEATSANWGRSGCSIYVRSAAKEVASITVFNTIERSGDVGTVRAIPVASLGVDEVRSESGMLASYMPSLPKQWQQEALRDTIVLLEESSARSARRMPAVATFVNMDETVLTEMAMCAAVWEVAEQSDAEFVFYVKDEEGRMWGAAANTFGSYLLTDSRLVIALLHPEQDPQPQLDMATSLPEFKKRIFIANVDAFYPQDPTSWDLQFGYVFGETTGRLTMPWLGRTPFNPTYLRLGAGAGWIDVLENWASVISSINDMRASQRKELMHRRFYDALGLRWLNWFNTDAALQNLCHRAMFLAADDIGNEDYHVMFDSYTEASVIASVMASVLQRLYTAAGGTDDSVADFLTTIINESEFVDAIALRLSR